MERKAAAPYTRVEKLPDRLRKSAAEHGYSNRWGIIPYAFKTVSIFYLNILAFLMPYAGPRVLIHKLRGVKIGKNVLIGFNVTLDNTYPQLITIKDGVSLAGHNLILAHSKPLECHENIFSSYIAPVVLEKNVWVTVGVIILAGVTIGEGSVIAAGSVVTDNIPPHCLAAGNPARVIKSWNVSKAG
jgi:acetyltransferase-like isoleucine patch superfamily enzyme